MHDVIRSDSGSDVRRSICRFRLREPLSVLDENFGDLEIDYLLIHGFWSSLPCSVPRWIYPHPLPPSLPTSPHHSPLTSICCVSVIRSLIDVTVTSQCFYAFNRYALLLLKTDAVGHAVGQAVGQAVGHAVGQADVN